MVAICFEAVDLDNRENWSFVADSFTVDSYEIYRPESLDTNWRKSAPIASIAELPKTVPLVIAAHRNAKYLQGEIALPDFEHPEACIYLFGHDHRNLDPSMVEGFDYQTVYIPVRYEMYSYQAGAMFLYDRLAKEWQTK